MSKQTLGKTLLRNVIRHTDAHNKIQEETEMWKMRDMEVNHVSATNSIRGHMHCDRMSYQSRMSSDHDDREARYWTRKLYEFEDNDPDRWGHSGFKELYPEEFESDSDKSSTTKMTGHHRSKASRSKHSKKSSHKKKKNKRKEAEEGKRKKSECSYCDSDDSSVDKHKQREAKSRHKNKKSDKTKERRDDERQSRRAHGRKRKNQDSHKRSDSDKKRRKDWRAAGEESSEESSGE